MAELVTQMQLDGPIQQARVAPVTYRRGVAPGYAVLHSNCAENDPYMKMFFIPTDTMRLSLFDAKGQLLWCKDLGEGVIPGVWFTTMLVWDLNGDGVDELYLSINETEHALDYEAQTLAAIDPATGQIAHRRQWPLPVNKSDTLSGFYRNLAVGAQAKGQRRLIIARGTYSPQRLICLDERYDVVWERIIDDGSRGAHTFVSVDLDGDGSDELLWGDRCLDLATGQDRWLAPAWRFDGHTDVVSPGRFRPDLGSWQVYYCREGWSGEGSGGTLMLDGQGERVWADRGLAHVDMGWTARAGHDASYRFYGCEIGVKSAGKAGFQRGGLVEHGYMPDGTRWEPKVSMAYSLPVDWDGDGCHELVYYGGDQAGQIVRFDGEVLERLNDRPLWAARVTDRPGEQIVCWDPAGQVRIYANPAARDSDLLRQRCAMPEYAKWSRSFAMGYSLYLLGGL